MAGVGKQDWAVGTEVNAGFMRVLVLHKLGEGYIVESLTPNRATGVRDQYVFSPFKGLTRIQAERIPRHVYSFILQAPQPRSSGRPAGGVDGTYRFEIVAGSLLEAIAQMSAKIKELMPGSDLGGFAGTTYAVTRTPPFIFPPVEFDVNLLTGVIADD
jgi:hypothetical protein